MPHIHEEKPWHLLLMKCYAEITSSICCLSVRQFVCLSRSHAWQAKQKTILLPGTCYSLLLCRMRSIAVHRIALFSVCLSVCLSLCCMFVWSLHVHKAMLCRRVRRHMHSLELCHSGLEPGYAVVVQRWLGLFFCILRLLIKCLKSDLFAPQIPLF